MKFSSIVKLRFCLFIPTMILLLNGCGTLGKNKQFVQSVDSSYSVINVPNTVYEPSKQNFKNKLEVTGGDTSQGGNLSKPPRIQEKREIGGNVSEIKVNNGGIIPNYYIYPPQQNSNPENKVSTANWQIRW